MTFNLFNNCYNLNPDFVNQTKIFGNANLPVCLTGYLPLLVKMQLREGYIYTDIYLRVLLVWKNDELIPSLSLSANWYNI